jgi:hypothetical protein
MEAAMSAQRRLMQPALLAVIVILTLATAYIHFWVGGIMLLLNAGGYAGLTLLVIGSTIVLPRTLPLILVALAAYAAVTIVGWLVIGPYFDVAYLAKAIEVALIATIGITLRQMPGEPRAAILWALSLVRQVLGAGRPSPDSLPSAAQGEE